MRWAVIALIFASSLTTLALYGEAKPELHRSPVDLAVLPGGARALTANHTSNSVSLIDLANGKVLAEAPCGKQPSAVACSRDGKRAAVANLWSNTVTLLEVNDTALKVIGEASAGVYPRGLLFAPDGDTLFVAASGSDEVLQLDWHSRKITQRWEAGREPRELALSPDGRLLAACSSRSGQVRCWEVASRRLVWERKIDEGFNLRGLKFTPDGQELIVGHALRREFPVSQHHIDSGWVIDNRLSKFPLDPKARYEHWQLALDLRGQAVADVHGLAYSPDGKTLAVAASGTHELVILEPGFLPWSPGEPGDFTDVSLEIGAHKMRRIDVGGRPLTVAFVDASRTLAVANYLRDEVQIVDVQAGKVVRSIHLGGPKEPSEVRQGEALFYDAQKSHHQWFSCHTCHPDGHTNGMRFDTLNDEAYGNPKLTPTLRNVGKTAPYTWHGWQQELSAAVEKSLTETMFGPKPKAGEVQALTAFLGTFAHPPNPHREANGKLDEAAQRGQSLFEGKARCVRCHKGDLYHSTNNYDLKFDDGTRFDLWNPPSLLGVFDRGPYLHDGRAESLERLLRTLHSSEKFGGEKLTEPERLDLEAFLKSL
jgi:YVTN family beta-propeller protein